MDLLENELVKKYFGCELHYNCSYISCRPGRALAVLNAMQEAINKGERCLLIGSNGTITETQWMSDPLFGVRTNAIRLPDAFQKRCSCVGACYGMCDCCKGQKPDAVEERIKRIREHYRYNGYKPCDRLEDELRELVELARKP